MHTIICAFDEREQAEQAMEQLVQGGLPRGDMHVEHRSVGGDARPRWGSDGTREDADEGGNLAAFGRFMATLLGQQDAGQAGLYAGHVERGSFVLVVDVPDEQQAEHVRAQLAALRAGDVNVLHRREQRPLRDIVGAPEGRTDLVERSRESWTQAAGDRAMASNRRAGDLQRPPGLRYQDQDGKDKPNR